MTCPAHRPRLRRLWRLPTVRVVGAAGPASVLLAAVLFPWPWASAAVLVAGAAGIAGYLHRNWGRVAVERRLLRALRDSAPRCPGDTEVPTLTAPVQVECGGDGVTRITARTYHDAIRALGYAMGRDRGFQLDLVRRTGGGRLSEVWGRTALPVDTVYRRLGLDTAARVAAEQLAEPERELLTAFADGVNAAYAHDTPFECSFLSYRPQPWRVEDSVLTSLVLSHSLSWNEDAKRAEAVVRRALPAPVAEFLLPGGSAAGPPPGLARHRAEQVTDDLLALDSAIPGSNCWIAPGDDGPLLANDLHLALGVPNVLYEVDLAWPGTRLRGLASPGLPVVLAGTNGRIAWGVTNLTADVLDLVPAEEQDLRTRTEEIRIRGRRPVTVDVTTVGTMPVAPDALSGEKVAVRWAGHDPRAADLRFQRLAHACDVDEAVSVLDDAHGVALNVLVTDRNRLRHVATGLLPRRPAGSPRGEPADGHLTGKERPRIVEPADGVLVSANDGALPEDEFRISLDLDPGHRARRIREVLGTAERHDAAGMRALQHDVTAALYLPYRDLAVSALRRGDPVRALLAEWDGTASTGSRAFGVLVRLRDILARRVLAPYVAVCREHEASFRFPFRDYDRPVLAILGARDPALLPAGTSDVDSFVADCVRAALPARPQKWGRLNRVGFRHPLTALAPWADGLLGIRPRAQAGTLHTVRTAVPGFGAAGRVVVTVDDLVTAELPAGQSGHPLSRHYADRHAGWASPVPLRPRARRTGCRHALRPLESR
ncbi:penicillin acylase family protein [Streptomyces sp. NPDC057067]|uniref:penicillin acylase family protein n=1 Tax=Streptomyces TaxID=1883 RepID=UPI0019206871|nr:penicillin acylase family protein [Streptomyces silvae]MBL1285923.1 penicillin acylase family protein [Streptomyces silvae]